MNTGVNTKEVLNNLRNKLPEAQREVDRIKNQILSIETSCSHQWSEPKQIYIEVTEFRMGALIRHGVDLDYESVPYKKEVPAWTRECKLCGKVEQTTNTTPVTTQTPRF